MFARPCGSSRMLGQHNRAPAPCASAVPCCARRRLHRQAAPHTRRPLVCAAASKVSELPASLAKIVGAFQVVPDPMARYKQLLFFATKLDKLPEELHTPENKVQGCVSQVWVVPELRSDGRIYWRADSDSQLTKGLAALLVNGLSGCTPQEIMSLKPDFIQMLGLQQSLTPSRNNGFLNMFKLMQRKTLEIVAQEFADSASDSDGTPATQQPSQPAIQPASSSAPASHNGSNGHSNGSTSRTPVQDGMRRKLGEALKPARLVIEDESQKHAGHAHMMGLGKAGSGETHFRVEVVSEAFEGKTLVQRHRMINQLLTEEFGLGMHALSLDTKTPAEAAKQQ